MIELLKTILTLALGFLIGFGVWYLIFWFLSNEQNPFQWHWVTKVVYLFISFSSTSSVIEKIY